MHWFSRIEEYCYYYPAFLFWVRRCGRLLERGETGSLSSGRRWVERIVVHRKERERTLILILFCYTTNLIERLLLLFWVGGFLASGTKPFVTIWLFPERGKLSAGIGRGR